jgi:ComF family protein
MLLSIPQCLKLPKICLICDMTYQGQEPICSLCLAYLPYLKDYCFSCGSVVKPPNTYCKSCIHDGSILHQFCAPFSYEKPIKDLIHLYKYQSGIDLVHFFCDLIIQSLPKSALKTQCLIPAPLHIKKLKKRGFHQTMYLAKHLSKKLKIPVSNQYCQKIKYTEAQSKLTKEERTNNLTHSFNFIQPPYEHITLIDDVHTTGTTLNSIAQGFEKLGIKIIDAWVIAKA